MKKIIKTAIAATMLAILATPVHADTLRYASGFPPGGPVNAGVKDFIQYINDNSDLKAKLFELSLLDLKDTPAGIRDGIADMGYVLMPYFPAEFAEANLAADLSMLSTTGEKGADAALTMAGALTEYAMLNCDDCQQQFKRENQVYLGSASTPEYVLLCTRPVRDIKDIKGLKMRAGVANFGRWAEQFGGIKISLPGNEIYEAMSQGVVDCAMISAPELINLQLIDVTKHITLGVPGGVFAGSGAANTNRETWTSLNQEQRAFLLKASAYNIANITIRYNNAARDAIEASRKKGIEILEPSPALQEASAAFVNDDIHIIVKQFADTYGLKNVDQKMETMSALIAKWKKLASGKEQDPTGFAEILWTEVYSKVDPATYGMH